MRKPLPLLAYLLLAACSGIEVTNPSCASNDAGGNHAPVGTGGSGGGSPGTGGTGGTGTGGVGGDEPAPVVVFPDQPIEIPSCPGGTGRLRVAATNSLDEPAFVELLDGPAEIELLPSEFELEPSGNLDVAMVSHADANDVPGTMRSGSLFLLVSAGSGQSDQMVEVKVPVASPELRKATVLCETSWPCEGLAFEGAPDTPIRQPLTIVNDGCAPVALEALQVESADADLTVTIDGPALPLELAPGESWQGAAVAQSPTPGVYAGKIVIDSDDDEAPARELLFSVSVDDQSTR